LGDISSKRITKGKDLNFPDKGALKRAAATIAEISLEPWAGGAEQDRLSGRRSERGAKPF
jgi:hypothetical protein